MSGRAGAPGARRLPLRAGRASFEVRVPFRGLRPGAHRLRIRVTDAAGNVQRQAGRFSRCARAAQVPSFTG